jgi:hypothetical protein
MRVWMKSNCPPGGGSQTRSSWRTSMLGSVMPASSRVSGSAAMTLPAAPTCEPSQRAYEPWPAPASRHRQPSRTPSAAARLKLAAS